MLEARYKRALCESQNRCVGQFGLVAEGLADIYPRFTPSMEWDTAAGDLLVTEVGKAIFRVTDGLPLEYNTLTLIHPGFIVRDTPH